MFKANALMRPELLNLGDGSYLGIDLAPFDAMNGLLRQADRRPKLGLAQTQDRSRRTPAALAGFAQFSGC